MREWWSKFRRIFGGREALSDDLADEIQANLDLETDDRVAQGTPIALARAEARRNFGNTVLIRESAREAWTFPRIETILQDLRYSLRGIWKSPGYSLIVILTLALGIGANTAIFSVVNAVLLKPLPYPEAERLVWLGESQAKAEGISVTWGNYRAWKKYNHTFDALAGYQWNHFTLTGRSEPLFTRAIQADHAFFGLLGAKPLLGRTFTTEEDRAGAPRTMVLSHKFWLNQFGGDGGVLGATLNLNGLPYRVIGVLPPGSDFLGQPVDFYVPIGLFVNDSQPRSQHGSMRVLGRLRPGVTLAAARGDLDEIMRRLAQEDPGTENDHRSAGMFLTDLSTGDIRPTLLLLMAAVGLILLIACSNVASLVLARSAARVREIAIRTAIGAGRSRLVRQVLTENLLTALIGGLLGLALGYWAVRALILIAPKGIPRLAEVTLDPRVLLFTAGITIFTGLLVGLAPILTAGRVDLTSALNAGGRSGTENKRQRSFRNALVVAEITVTLVLAFSSGLLLRSLFTAQNSGVGFAPDHLLALELVLPESSYSNPQAVRNFYDQLLGSLRTLPGAIEAGAGNCPPPAGDCGDWWYSVVGAPVPAKPDVPLSLFNVADPGYFHTMGIPLREGRNFTAADRSGVVIVNEVLARQWFPNSSAIGHQIKYGGPYLPGPTFEIVGVVGNVRQEGLGTDSNPEIYQPFAQNPSHAMAVMLRTAGDPKALTAAARRAVASLDKNLPIQSLGPQEAKVSTTLNRRRFATILLVLFAGLALVLSSIGVYGLINYWVAQREEEIAIRMALGAGRSGIIAWAGGSAARLIGLGVLLGVGAAWWASHLLDALLFGVSPHDLGMLGAALLAVVSIAILAAAIPLSRAIRVDAARKLQRA
ncbi:MAG TPA: ABC transporter permease [Bryobacteraceae bacterium]|nr:ABC transporter permease [Bryobacteraceae bacterium]